MRISTTKCHDTMTATTNIVSVNQHVTRSRNTWTAKDFEEAIYVYVKFTYDITPGLLYQLNKQNHFDNKITNYIDDTTLIVRFKKDSNSHNRFINYISLLEQHCDIAFVEYGYNEMPISILSECTIDKMKLFNIKHNNIFNMDGVHKWSAYHTYVRFDKFKYEQFKSRLYCGFCKCIPCAVLCTYCTDMKIIQEMNCQKIRLNCNECTCEKVKCFRCNGHILNPLLLASVQLKRKCLYFGNEFSSEELISKFKTVTFILGITEGVASGVSAAEESISFINDCEAVLDFESQKKICICYSYNYYRVVFCKNMYEILCAICNDEGSVSGCINNLYREIVEFDLPFTNEKAQLIINCTNEQLSHIKKSVIEKYNDICDIAVDIGVQTNNAIIIRLPFVLQCNVLTIKDGFSNINLVLKDNKLYYEVVSYDKSVSNEIISSDITNSSLQKQLVKHKILNVFNNLYVKKKEPPLKRF